MRTQPFPVIPAAAAPRNGPGRLFRAVALLLALAAIASLATVPEPASAAADSPPPARSWFADLAGEVRSSDTTVADLDGDGHDEILVGSIDGHLSVFNGNGSLRWRRPVRTPGSNGPVAVDASPTVADIDGDGVAEILVGAGSLFAANQHGGLVVFDRDGNQRWARQFGDIFNAWRPGAGPDGYAEPVTTSPVLGDVDGDGRTEIIVAPLNNRVHVLRPDGSDLPGWVGQSTHPGSGYWIDDAVFSTPVAVDGDGDGRDEIYFGATASAGGTVDVAGGVLLALELEAGRAGVKWIRAFDDVMVASPVVTDINGDGRFELITGAGYEYTAAQPGRGDWRRVFAIHLDDASNVPGWPVTLDGEAYAAPALGDLDGNGRDEVVVATIPHQGGDGRVVALRGDGSVLWSRPPNTCFSYGCEGGGGIYASPVIADLDGDGRQDVAVSNGWGTFLLRGSDGARLTHAIEIGRASQGGLAVARSGGVRQLVTASLSPNAPRGRVSAYPLPSSAADPAWPQFRRTADKRGVIGAWVDIELSPSGAGYWRLGADGTVRAHGDALAAGSATGRLRPSEQAVSLSATPSGNGYWVFTSLGRALPFGGAGFHGDMAGVRLNGPVLDSVPTPSGAGYYMVASDGGVFAFGDAAFRGSMGGRPLNQPVQSLAPTPDGHGYWLVAADGGVFAFGSAPFWGSMGGRHLNRPVTGMVPYGAGYLLVARDGGVFTFSDRPFTGSLGSSPPRSGVASISPHPSGNGYVLLDSAGIVYPFGAARTYP